MNTDCAAELIWCVHFFNFFGVTIAHIPRTHLHPSTPPGGEKKHSALFLEQKHNLTASISEFCAVAEPAHVPVLAHSPRLAIQFFDSRGFDVLPLSEVFILLTRHAPKPFGVFFRGGRNPSQPVVVDSRPCLLASREYRHPSVSLSCAQELGTHCKTRGTVTLCFHLSSAK